MGSVEVELCPLSYDIMGGRGGEKEALNGENVYIFVNSCKI